MTAYLICNLISKNILYCSGNWFDVLDLIVRIRCHFEIIRCHGSRERQCIRADTIDINYIFYHRLHGYGKFVKIFILN